MIIAILTSFALAQTPQADTVRLSLDAALARAREANPTLRAERADARAASALALQATRAFLPSVTLDAMGMRTTDPVAVFGLKLRQGAFQASDLALSALNDPAAYPGWSASATVEQPILAPEGLFGYAAARRGAAARNAGARRAAGATAYYVARTYWGAQLAAQRLRALDTALAAARAHVQQATALHEQGLVTGLDARLASLRASEVEARRLAAHADAENARSALATILALPDDASLVLTDSLDAPLPTPPCAGDTTCDVAHRGDVMALRLGAQALGLGVDRAWASQLPQIAAFGSFAHYSRTSPFGNGSGDWTIGIGLKWNILQGLGGPGAVREAAAARDAARARAEAGERQARLEVRSAERMLAAARARVLVAEHAAAEAGQTLAQAQLRYRTGASSIMELLDVQTAATNATLNLLAARHDALVASAALAFAAGANDQ